LLKEKEKELSVGIPMRDIAFILVTVLFFALALLYLRGCERLK
jgi:hypothetical protein